MYSNTRVHLVHKYDTYKMHVKCKYIHTGKTECTKLKTQEINKMRKKILSLRKEEYIYKDEQNKRHIILICQK